MLSTTARKTFARSSVPESGGYSDWLNHLNAHPGDFDSMVRGFVDSTEYRNRF
ncbi:MAG: DUF4214 domain-containing protein [Acidobacteria bacterium]|nr:DUF4214 domain-containing protein [Acidobacteriota bacterium]